MHVFSVDVAANRMLHPLQVEFDGGDLLDGFHLPNVCLLRRRLAQYFHTGVDQDMHFRPMKSRVFFCWLPFARSV